MIIGLTGYARSGKDTVANILVENYGYTRVAFADKIRELLYETNPQVGSTRLQALVSEYGWDVAKSSPEVRHLLQELGVGARKVFGESFWVHEAMKTMLNDPRPDLNYVITDVRFFNEADMIKANQGQLWRVERPGITAVNNHVSESELNLYAVNHIIENNGDLDNLTSLVSERMVGFLA